MTNVYEYKEIDQRFPMGYIFCNEFAKVSPLIEAPPCVTIAGEVDNMPGVIDKKVIDQLSLPRLLRGHGESFVPREHID